MYVKRAVYQRRRNHFKRLTMLMKKSGLGFIEAIKKILESERRRTTILRHDVAEEKSDGVQLMSAKMWDDPAWDRLRKTIKHDD